MQHSEKVFFIFAKKTTLKESFWNVLSDSLKKEPYTLGERSVFAGYMLFIITWILVQNYTLMIKIMAELFSGHR